MDRRTMVVALALALAAPGIAAGADTAKEQAEVRQAGQDALQVYPGVWVYQLTGTDLALALTAKGTEYYEDGNLNWRHRRTRSASTAMPPDTESHAT